MICSRTIASIERPRFYPRNGLCDTGVAQITTLTNLSGMRPSLVDRGLWAMNSVPAVLQGRFVAPRVDFPNIVLFPADLDVTIAGGHRTFLGADHSGMATDLVI